MNEDLAEDFEDCYEVGMTVPFDFELIARHIGGRIRAGRRRGCGGVGKYAADSLYCQRPACRLHGAAGDG